MWETKLGMQHECTFSTSSSIYFWGLGKKCKSSPPENDGRRTTESSLSYPYYMLAQQSAAVISHAFFVAISFSSIGFSRQRTDDDKDDNLYEWLPALFRTESLDALTLSKRMFGCLYLKDMFCMSKFKTNHLDTNYLHPLVRSKRPQPASRAWLHWCKEPMSPNETS